MLLNKYRNSTLSQQQNDNIRNFLSKPHQFFQYKDSVSVNLHPTKL